MSQRGCFVLPPCCHLPALTFPTSFAAPSRPLPPRPLPTPSSPMSPPRWWPSASRAPLLVPALELHLLEINVPRIFFAAGRWALRSGAAWGAAPRLRGGARAPGRWLLFKPGPLFCSLPLCAWRGFCCSLKRLNSCSICRRAKKGSADALGNGGNCGVGGPEHPPVGMDPRGSCGQGSGQHTGHGGLCKHWVSL